MTDPQKTPEPGPLKVVDGHELEEHTTTGWVLVESFDETAIEECFGQEAQHMGDPNSSYSNGTVSTTRHIPTTCRKFLLGYDRRSTIAEQYQELKELRDKVTTFETNFEELEKSQRDLRADLEYAKSQREEACQSYDRQHQETTRLKEQLRAMEEDMGKVRTAIGDIKFGEIVGAR